MIPLSTRFGNFVNMLEENTPFSEIDTSLKQVAKNIIKNRVDGANVYDYVLKSSFLSGPSEIITVSEKNGIIQLIGIKSKDPEEYRMIAGIIRNASPMINLVQDNGNSEVYTNFEEDLVFIIGQSVYQKGDNILTVMRND